MINVKKNFLSKESSTRLEETITQFNFPWFVQKEISLNDQSGYCYFTHLLYEKGKANSPLHNIVMPEFIKKLKIKNLIRSKLNLYTKTEKIIEHIFHIDYDQKHMTALYFINSNNGPFVFKKPNKKIIPEKNKCVIFNGEHEHRSSSCTDEPYRLTLNINYEL